MTSQLTTLQQFLLFTSTILVTGCVAWRLFVAPDVEEHLAPPSREALGMARRRAARWALAASVGVVLGWLLRGAVQLIAFRDPFVPIREDIDLLLFQTFWGTVWMAQGGVALLLAGATAAAVRGASSDGGTPQGPSSKPWLAAAILVFALAGTLAGSGHAMGADSWRAVALTADGLHALAAGAWIGTLAIILIVSRGSAGEAGTAFYAAQLRRFSPLALVSGTTLVGMGVILSWTHLHAVSDLWTSTYGRLLSAKIGLAAVVFAMGFVNWRRGLPVLDSEAGSALVRRRAAAEVATATGVVLLTAILVHATKP